MAKNAEFSTSLNVTMITSAAAFLFFINLFVESSCFIIEKELELDNHPCRAENLKVILKKSKYHTEIRLLYSVL